MDVSAVIRSILAVLAGIATVVVLSEGTDAGLRAAGIFPPLEDKAAHTTATFAAATIYRTLAGVAGGYVTATVAPANPMLHAMILGTIGLALSVAGIVANVINQLGPDWYPIALAVTAFPSVWIGARLRTSSRVAKP
jgi:hypothetical protein